MVAKKESRYDLLKGMDKGINGLTIMVKRNVQNATIGYRLIIFDLEKIIILPIHLTVRIVVLNVQNHIIKKIKRKLILLIKNGEKKTRKKLLKE